MGRLGRWFTIAPVEYHLTRLGPLDTSQMHKLWEIIILYVRLAWWWGAVDFQYYPVNNGPTASPWWSSMARVLWPCLPCVDWDWEKTKATYPYCHPPPTWSPTSRADQGLGPWPVGPHINPTTPPLKAPGGTHWHWLSWLVHVSGYRSYNWLPERPGHHAPSISRPHSSPMRVFLLSIFHLLFGRFYSFI